MSRATLNAEALAAVQGGHIIAARVCDCDRRCRIPYLLVRQRRGGPVIRIDLVADRHAMRPAFLVQSDNSPAKINPVPGARTVDPAELEEVVA